jgi:hypothetical protein
VAVNSLGLDKSENFRSMFFETLKRLHSGTSFFGGRTKKIETMFCSAVSQHGRSHRVGFIMDI